MMVASEKCILVRRAEDLMTVEFLLCSEECLVCQWLQERPYKDRILPHAEHTGTWSRLWVSPKLHSCQAIMKLIPFEGCQQKIRIPASCVFLDMA
jgi:hypothetical protein